MKSKKVDCVLAMVSRIVVDYWHQVGDPEDFISDQAVFGDPCIEARLDQLNYVVKHWSELKVAGNIRERYYLDGIPELEEPTPDLTDEELKALDDLTGEEDEQIETEPLRAEETESETIQGS